jgi:hypothetical protein
MARFNKFKRQYGERVWIAVGVLAIAAFTVGRLIPRLRDILFQEDVILLLIFLMVLDISITLSNTLQSRESLTVSRDQDSDTGLILTKLQGIRCDTADLLEYSTATVEPIIKELERQQARVRILVKHPDSVGKYQKNRILASLKHLSNFVIKDCRDRIDVRC